MWESEGASCIRRNRVPAVRTAAVANEPTLIAGNEQDKTEQTRGCQLQFYSFYSFFSYTVSDFESLHALCMAKLTARQRSVRNGLRTATATAVTTEILDNSSMTTNTQEASTAK